MPPPSADPSTTTSWLSPRSLGAIALSLVALGALALLVSRARGGPRGEDAPLRDLATGRGERTSTTLADGTRIRLGPMSHIRYDIGSDGREVTLSGVAAFDVRHGGRRSFVVRVAGARVVDLGTSFVVRAYPADSAVIVAVTEGRVSLGATTRASAATLDVAAGQVGTVGATGDATLKGGVDPAILSAPIDGRLAFHDTPMRDVAIELGRWFVVDVRLRDSTLARRRISGVYPTDDLTAVLDALAKTLGAAYARDGRIVTFRAAAK